jgi:hypothetical protein
MEDSMALKFANFVKPIDFCCLPDKMETVTDRIFSTFSSKHKFKITAINQENDAAVLQKEAFVYKIIDFL